MTPILQEPMWNMCACYNKEQSLGALSDVEALSPVYISLHLQVQ